MFCGWFIFSCFRTKGDQHEQDQHHEGIKDRKEVQVLPLKDKQASKCSRRSRSLLKGEDDGVWEVR